MEVIYSLRKQAKRNNQFRYRGIAKGNPECRMLRMEESMTPWGTHGLVVALVIGELVCGPF